MASFTPNVPPSAILRSKTVGSENEPRRQTKQEFRKQKELEEGRKAGTVPAMTDVETGRDINPHIPHYISNVPWYVDATGPTLKHQRPHPERQAAFSGFYEAYKKGEVYGSSLRQLHLELVLRNFQTWNFRFHVSQIIERQSSVRGHAKIVVQWGIKKKQCFEKPRKVGAKYSNTDIAPDEMLPEDLKQTYDAKPDRWTGFDPSEYAKVVEEFKRVEEARKIIKTGKLMEEKDEKKQSDGEVHERVKEEEDDSQDEDKYAEGADMPGVKIDHDSSTRITVRNLRIREDTAKYLYNLDPDSAYYDPKSRAMREDPFKNVSAEKRPASVSFMGDNFQRYTGEVKEADKGQIFAWEAQRKGLDVHALAEPTKLEALRREYEGKKKTIKSNIERTILEKYGGQEHLLDEETKHLLFHAQSETYTEYSRKGELVKGQEKCITRSRYEEDFYPTNHTSVFGSYWCKGRWGYKCCKSFVENSYCLGNSGVEKTHEHEQVPTNSSFEIKSSLKGSIDQSDSGSESDSESSSWEDRESDPSAMKRQESYQKRTDRKRRRRDKRCEKSKNLTKKAKISNKDTSSESSSSSSDTSKSESESDSEKATLNSDLEIDLVKRALLKQVKQEKEARFAADMDDRRRPYNSMKEVKPLCEADMEAYKLRKLHAEDPMATYFDK